MNSFVIVMAVWIAGQGDAGLIEGFRSMRECQALQRNYERSMSKGERVIAKCAKLERR